MDKPEWALDFLLGQQISDESLRCIFNVYQLPLNNHKLEKKFLLRQLSSQLHQTPSSLISTTTLDTLESIDQIDSRINLTTLLSLRSAYFVILCECAGKHLPVHGPDEERNKAALLGLRERLVKAENVQGGNRRLYAGRNDTLMKEIDLAVRNSPNKNSWLGEPPRVDAVTCVKEYLKEAEEQMGLSFLERAAAEVLKKKPNPPEGSL